MEFAKELIDQIDNFKEKITNEEYKNLCDLLLKMSKKSSTDVYEFTIFYSDIKLNSIEESCSCPRCSDNEESVNTEHMEYILESNVKTKTFIGKLKNCPCYYCNENQKEKCQNKKIYEGKGEVMSLHNISLCSIIHNYEHESNMGTIYFPYEDCGPKIKNIMITTTSETIYIISKKIDIESY